MTFQKLNVSEPILKALHEKGYTNPTSIQEQVIPAILSGSDVLTSAQTGTGKTASFAIPMLQRLSEQPGSGTIRGLVIAPTRELAIQVSENLAKYGKHLPLRSVLVYGGVPQFHQVKQIRRGADIIIATPGRLMDLIQQKVMNLSKVNMLVLDEADRMLDMGFLPDIKKILTMVPDSCQKIFLSATIPQENVMHEKTATAIQQGVYHVAREDKRALLKHVISEQQMRNVLVFARTKRGADKIAHDLTRSGINAEAFHGDKSQVQRQRSLSNFKRNTTRVLVATDVAARGIDIIDLPFVINYEMPDTVETYTHRIGRTGRAGNTGTALTFCDHAEKRQLKALHRVAPGKIKTLPNPFAA